LFSGSEQDKPLGSLSGGERSRAVLAGLVAGAHNVLVLDEPTNHLDIPSAERLEQAISTGGGYDGTMLLISHDRMLLQDTCEKLIVFSSERQGDVKVFPGDYAEWSRRERAKLRQATAVQISPKAKAQTIAKPQASNRGPAKPAKLTGLAVLSMAKLESNIEQVQGKIANIDRLMLDPAVLSDGQKNRSLQIERSHLELELEPLEKEWARRAEEG
jgi:ATP-binding cassette, subfamily F, member 3